MAFRFGQKKNWPAAASGSAVAVGAGRPENHSETQQSNVNLKISRGDPPKQ